VDKCLDIDRRESDAHRSERTSPPQGFPAASLGLGQCLRFFARHQISGGPLLDRDQEHHARQKLLGVLIATNEKRNATRHDSDELE
jgi:hypothetical protein